MNVSRRAFSDAVVRLLFGPVIAVGHFMAVYLFAEVACRAGWLRFRALGMDGVALVTVVVTLVAAAVTVALTVGAYRRRSEPHGDLSFTGFLLGALFTVAILFVGIPTAFLRAC